MRGTQDAASSASARGTSVDELMAGLDRLADLANASQRLVHLGRQMDADFIIVIGDKPCFVSVRNGRVGAIERRPQIMRRSSFCLRAEAETWRQFWRPMPAPGWHDIFALMKYGRLVIEGDIHLLMCHLQYVKDLLALPRQLAEAQ